MKILAIRGQNLASLAKAFVVDLQASPMSGEGLFAITGQTGSGKSTLLDAMCLALFDKTPRLSKGGTKIGRDDDDKERQAGSSDPRTILRRGAGIGYAEVDFLGVDERVYRSRWNVRRSRNKPSGRLQATRMELWDVASRRRLDSDKKTETLALIEARLGLGFAQFRRSVLLPQGEFAAFLKADEEERSALLERMTGTQVYRDISVAAHQRAKSEKLAYERVAEKLTVLTLLEPADRAALETQLLKAQATERTQHALASQAEAAVAWHARQAELLASLGQAGDSVRHANEARAALQAVEVELTAIAAVEVLRPLLGERRRAGQALSAATLEQERLEVLLESARIKAEQTTQESGEADRALQAARDEQERMNDELSQAASLDGELASLARSVGQSHRESREAAAALQAAQREVTTTRARLDEALSTSRADASWLEEHAGLRELSEGWSRWSRDLQRAVGARTQRLSAEAALPAAEAALAQSHARLQEATAALSEASRVLAPLREAVAQAREALSDHSSAEPSARRLDRHRQRLERLQERRQHVLDLHGQISACQQKAAGVRAQRTITEATISAAEEQSQRLTWMLEEAERSLGDIRADEVLTARRRTLVAGEHCPLCGATEHPWAGEQHGSSAFLERQEQRVRDLRADLSKQKLRAQHARDSVSRLAHQEQEAEGSVATLSSRLLERRAEWASAASGLSLPPVDEAGEALLAAMMTADTELKQVETQLAEVTRLRARLEAAERSRDAAEERVVLARGQVYAAEKQEQAARRQLDTLTEQRGRASQQESEVEDILASPLLPLGDWQAALSSEPDAFVARAAALAERYRSASEQVSEAEAVVRALRPKLEAAHVRLREREGTSRRLKAASLERAERLESLQARRRALLRGQDTATVRERLRKEIALAQQRAASLSQLRSTVEHRSTELSAHLTAARGAMAQRLEESTSAQSSLEAALRERGLSLEDVQRRLSRSADWVTSKRQEVEAASAAQSRAQAVLTERQGKCEAHAAGRPEHGTEAEASATLSEALSACDAARRQVYTIQGRLESDVAERKRAAGLIAERDAQRAVWEHWSVMDKLIGSAKGKSFSQFAQSLTLDALLMQSNQHLRGLSQRYSLMRVPGEDLVLQIVDHYHGDEVRSVNSLSGGESFLVSLALALGLATLSARDTRIGSLFIDEGFGTLDPDTLDVALSSLDALQASGRQVGLISHVPGMSERIGVQIQVVPRGGGRSIVRTVG